jgi:hypothetical protein
MNSLAHEFHHIGFNNCFSKRDNVFQRANMPLYPRDIVVQLIYHLAMEGLANHFCTPQAVRKGIHKRNEENMKIAFYEEGFILMLQESFRLIDDCFEESVPFSKLNERVLDFIIDTESILPKVHFLGERIISLIAENSDISLYEIYEICNYPENLVSYYNVSAHEIGLPFLSDERLEQVIDLFSQ